MKNDSESAVTGSLEGAVAYRIYRVARILRIHLIRFLENQGFSLSPEQFFVLIRVYDRGSGSQSELADPRFEDHPNITRLIDSLVRQGFVARRPVKGDRRQRAVVLTESGREAANRLSKALAAERNALYGDIDPEELQKVMAILDRIEGRAAVRAGIEGGSS